MVYKKLFRTLCYAYERGAKLTAVSCLKMSQISQIPLLLIGGVSVAIWLGWRVLAKASSGVNAPLAQLPLMKFDENDVPQRYISETGKLLRDGYRKVCHNY